MHFHLQWIVAPAVSSSSDAVFFIIPLGLQQIDFYVPTENRRVLLICKMDSKSKGPV